MPITAPTVATINTTQEFRRVAVSLPKPKAFKGVAPNLNPNPYTGLASTGKRRAL